MKSIVIFIDYFGCWPKWFPVFLASCKSNKTINWIIRTDCQIPQDPPPNVKFIHTSYDDYVKNISEKLEINFNPSGNYKICDIRPAYGTLYRDDIGDYDYYGFGDIDVIYGNIRKFYTEEVLSYDVISTHDGMLSGHLALFRNIDTVRNAYLKIPRWKEYFENPDSTRFDEDVYSLLFHRRGMNNSDFELLICNIYFIEQYTTVFHPMTWHDGIIDHPEIWFWKDGAVTNNRNLGREYIYLHLMNFESMRWTRPEYLDRYIPWKKNPNMRFTAAGEEIDGVKISWDGIQPLGER